MSKVLSFDHEERAKAVEALIPENIKNILDVGCGPGDITNRLEKYEVVALDINSKCLDKVLCKEKVTGSIEELPFETDSFELVLCTSVLEHLEKSVLEKGIKELKRVSKKYLLISTPYLENLKLGYIKCQDCGKYFNAYGHLRSFTYKELLSLFSEYTAVSAKLTGKGMQPWDDKLLEKRLKIGGMTFRQRTCPYCGYFNKKKTVYSDENLELIARLEKLNKEKVKDIKRVPSHVTILFEKR